MGHLEGNFTPVQYIWDARVLKVKSPEFNDIASCSSFFFCLFEMFPASF